ncbi:MAG: N-acyl amino acid synthase FeeM domain-containing protein [Gammaproteobacteria bacterium]
MIGKLLDLVALDTGFAQNDAERDACYAIRYQVYVEEQGRQPPLADHGRKLDRNADDATGLLMYVRNKDVIVGTLRLHHGLVTGMPPFVREACGLADDPAALQHVAAVSRLAITAEHRGSRATIALLRAAFDWLNASPRSTQQLYILALDEPKLVAMYRMLGFRLLQPESRYKTDLGPTVPMVSTLKP